MRNIEKVLPLLNKRLSMQIFIYNEEFFYKKILSSSKESIKDLIENKK